jgi:hypothetical protein
MGRIFWILVLALIAVVTVPPLRERARPQIEYVLNPIYQWDARNRVNEIYRVLERERAQGNGMPKPRDFNEFLAARDGADAAVDPWKEPFYLVASRRTYYVGSAGPDRRRGTVDDIVSKTGVTVPGR